MKTLTTLKGKDPREVVRLLSVVSSSLLPNPGIGEVVRQTDKDPEFVKAVLNEIRGMLHISEDDYSVRTQSLIYALLSQEMSKAALANADLNSIENRLGSRGDLDPSKFEVSFTEDFKKIEYLGVRRSHAADAVTWPDKAVNINPKYVHEDRELGITISLKYVTGKRSDDRFILIVLSHRTGRYQKIGMAWRAYFTEVALHNLNQPLDILRSFVNTYGFTFRIGNVSSKFMHQEIVSDALGINDLVNVDAPKDHLLARFASGGFIKTTGRDGGRLMEVVLGFTVDVTKYVATLRKHRVYLDPEAEKLFQNI